MCECEWLRQMTVVFIVFAILMFEQKSKHIFKETEIVIQMNQLPIDHNQ